MTWYILSCFSCVIVLMFGYFDLIVSIDFEDISVASGKAYYFETVILVEFCIVMLLFRKGIYLSLSG